MNGRTLDVDEYLCSLPPEKREKAKRAMTPDVVNLVDRIFALPEYDQDAVIRELERLIGRKPAD